MKLLIRLRSWLLKLRVVNAMEKITGSRHSFKWLTYSNTWIIHCLVDGCTPEESVLYIVGETFKHCGKYSDCEHLKFLPYGKLSSSVNKPENADEWFTVAKQWRDEGNVRVERLHEFVKTLDFAKSRWPEIFNGKTPYVRKYWEVHFDYMPAGIATLSPATKPITVFDNFTDATKYVEEHSTEEYWWHSYDLFEAAKMGKIPEWEATPTPHYFNRIDKPGYIGYNSFWHQSADCIFATPRESYMKWLNAVIEGDVYRENEIRNGFVYNHVIDAGAWCVRYVEHEEPIDNENPNANIPEEYLVERCEY